MTRLNLKEASLLDVSGELGKKAQGALARHLAENQAANEEYQAIREGFELLEKLPAVKLSPRQRRQIPTRIINALQLVFQNKQAEKEARERQRLIQWAMAGVGAVAAAIAIVLGVGISVARATNYREHEQMAAINATIDRFATWGDQRPTSYDQAVTDVEASIRQLQTDSPTLSEVHDKNMGKLLDVLATLPLADDDFSMEPGSL